LKLIERERARGRLFAEKLRMQRTKQTVLNQQMLNPAIKQTKNTCSATYESEFDRVIKFTINCMLRHLDSLTCVCVCVGASYIWGKSPSCQENLWANI